MRRLVRALVLLCGTLVFNTAAAAGLVGTSTSSSISDRIDPGGPGTDAAIAKAAVTISGSVRNDSGIPLCALVLANGQFMFSCSPNGFYSLNVPLDAAGQFTIFGFAEGHFPYKGTFSSGGNHDITLVAVGPAGQPGFSEELVKSWRSLEKTTVSIYGSVRNNRGEALCALVLANGQFVFSCSPSGSYSLDVPLDAAGQYTLFVFAEGHFPYKGVFVSGGRHDVTATVVGPRNCTYTYSQWSSCQANGTQTRSVVSSSPAGCMGTPVLQQSCTPPQNGNVTWQIHDGCSYSQPIDYRFIDFDHHWYWPEPGKVYFINSGQTQSVKLSCFSGYKVCLGAETRDRSLYWGVDLDGSASCSDCCAYCDGKTYAYNFCSAAPPPPANVCTGHSGTVYNYSSRVYCPINYPYYYPGQHGTVSGHAGGFCYQSCPYIGDCGTMFTTCP